MLYKKSLRDGIEIRFDSFIGVQTIIAPVRAKRIVKSRDNEEKENTGCIFCEDNIRKYVKLDVFGEEINYHGHRLFFNKYPFHENHFVLTFNRHVYSISSLAGMFGKSFELLDNFRSRYFPNSFFFLGMNFGREAGASQSHPHMQVVFSSHKPLIAHRFSNNFYRFKKWINKHEELGLKEDVFIFPFAPLGERHIVLIKETSNLVDITPYVESIVDFYAKSGSKAFNFVIFPVKKYVVGSFITRYSNKCISDYGFYESLFLEKVVSLFPEDVCRDFITMMK